MDKEKLKEIRLLARALCPVAKVCPWCGVPRICVYCIHKLLYQRVAERC